MKIIDISMPIYHEMPVYKGRQEKRPNLKVQSDFDTSSAYETILEMNMHTGTHLDRSQHMIPNGTRVESLALEKVITKCKVLDFTDVVEIITEEDLKTKNIEEGDFVLLKTKNSLIDILEGEFIYLGKSGAEYLKNKKVKGVGIDALSIERGQPNHDAHIILLEIDCVILEGVRLGHVEEGEYFLFAAPIYVVGAEAAPIRAVLLQEFKGEFKHDDI